MNRDKMLEWADVLESGRYQQNHGGWGSVYACRLCCLNVALVHFTGCEAGRDRENRAEDIHLARDRVRELFGWNTNYHYDLVHEFMRLNDSSRLTFPEIAEKIREIVYS